MNRREFLFLTAAFAAGCGPIPSATSSAAKERIVNAGPIKNYDGDGLYANLRNQGFFIIRRGDKLFALSSRCTHRNCKLDAEKDQSFSCQCHGSTFDPDGHVTEGPARRNLPLLPTTVNNGELLVTVTV